MANFVIKLGSIWVPEKFTGEKCSLCNDAIYGDGLRLVLTVYPAEDFTFKQTEVKCCTSCGEAIKNI
jgi:hypothetical protein